LVGSVEIKTRQPANTSGGLCQGLPRGHRHTVALLQVLPIVYDLRSVVDLASCSGDFLMEQIRGFHDLLRQKPTSLFILL
jgi:hypothetical protein